MSLNDNPPPQWTTFIQLVKQNMPLLPQMSQTRIDEGRGTIGKALGVMTTLLDGAGIALPPNVGELISAGTAGSLADFAQSNAEGAVLSRVAGGTIIGGGLETLRGGNQALQRSHETLTYVLGMTGYITTLGRMCLTAISENRHDTPFPTPLIPADMTQRGDLFTQGRREMYRNGANRAWQVITELDNVRPADPTADHYSKGCLAHIAIATGHTNVPENGSRLMRQQCESKIAREILNNDLQSQRERLRRWANS